MLRDYEVELLEKMVQEEQYKNNIPLCTPFIKDFLEAYKKSKDRATPMKPVKKYYITRYGNCGQKKRVDILCPRCASKFINGVRGSIGVYAEREDEFIETINNQKYCMFCSQAIDWSKEDANTTD